jgi:hypothetical protein
MAANRILFNKHSIFPFEDADWKVIIAAVLCLFVFQNKLVVHALYLSMVCDSNHAAITFHSHPFVSLRVLQIVQYNCNATIQHESKTIEMGRNNTVKK